MIVPDMNIYFLPIIATIFLIIHLFYIGLDDFYPRETFSRFEKRKLEEIEFPVIFKICIYPGINNTALKEVGYSEIWDYFTGKSDHNKSFYGWAGHTADGKIFSSVKVKYV